MAHPHRAQAASFSCSYAVTFIEQAVCGDPLLSRKDEIMAERYRAANAADPSGRTLAAQRAWLAELATCPTAVCLNALYDRRIAELSDTLATVAAQPGDMSRYYSRAFQDCMSDPEPMAGRELFCADAEHKRWDAELNATYQQIMANLSPAQQLALQADERAWLKRESAECDSAGVDPASPYGRPSVCYLDETVRRVLYLRAYR